MVIEANDLQVPGYLDGKFFKDALENGLRTSSIVVNHIAFEMGSGAGDNYCSSIYRVKVKYQRAEDRPSEDISLIVKSIPVVEETQFLNDLGVFMIEKGVYYDVLPRLEVLLDGVKFGAKCFYTTREPIQTIVFDDLKTYGFTTASRQDGLDEEHCKLALTKLAQFHAASMVLLEKDPAIAQNFTKGMLCPETIHKTDTFKKMFGGQLKFLAEISAQWEGFEKISEKLHRYHDNFNKNVIETGRSKDGEVRVLNHGDMWVNNFMFKYENDDKSKPVDMYFVDFQCSYFCSLGCDVNFFFNSSVKLDILRNKRDELVETYYNALKTALEEMRFKAIPKLDDIKRELRERERYGLFSLFGFLPMISMDSELSNDNSIESLVDDESAKKKFELIFSAKKLQDLLKYGLKRFDDLGVLD